MNVVPEGLARLLLAALEIPGVTRADLRALEVADEHLSEPPIESAGKNSSQAQTLSPRQMGRYWMTNRSLFVPPARHASR